MNEQELRDCPFCGGKALLRNMGSYRDGKEIDSYMVTCASQCMAYKCYLYDSQPAAEAWNTRPHPTLSFDEAVEIIKQYMWRVEGAKYYFTSDCKGAARALISAGALNVRGENYEQEMKE